MKPAPTRPTTVEVGGLVWNYARTKSDLVILGVELHVNDEQASHAIRFCIDGVAQRVTDRPQLARNYVSSRETERLGLGLGRKIGLLDPTTKPVTERTYATGRWDGLHRQITVVDSYCAAVDLEHLRLGGIDVVIQVLGAEELYARIPTHDPSVPPPRGVKAWKHVFEGPELVEQVLMLIE